MLAISFAFSYLRMYFFNTSLQNVYCCCIITNVNLWIHTAVMHK